MGIDSRMDSLRKSAFEIACAVALISAVALFFHLQSLNISGLDPLYHVRHSALYQAEGLGMREFPWASASVIRDAQSDLWYGFHVLLVPIAALFGAVGAIKAGGIMVTIGAALFFFFALRMLEVRWPLALVFFWMFSTAEFLYHTLALRPQALTIGFSALLLAVLARHPAWRSIIFLLTFLISWMHLGFVWLPLGIVALTSALRWFFERTYRLDHVLLAGGGIILGWLLRPNPFGALKLFYVQIVELLLEKQGGMPLLYGTELLRYTKADFFHQFLPLTALILTAVWMLFWLRPTLKWLGRTNTEDTQRNRFLQLDLWTSGIITLVFFWLSFVSGRRSADIFITFAFLFIGVALARALGSSSLREITRRAGTAATSIVCILLLGMVGITLYRYYKASNQGYNPYSFQPAAQWLVENSEAGDVVFHTHWDQFAPLFFWNQKNFYINGMDPIFEYSRNPALYWKHHFFSLDHAAEFTCGKVRCTQEEVEESYAVLKNEFGARYIYLQKRRNPNFAAYLSGDARYERVFENDKDIIFKIH